MFSLGSCLFDLNSSVWKHSMLGQVLVVHSCLVQDILTSSLRVRMQGCPSHRGTSVKDKVRWAAQITPALVHPWGADWAHLFVLPFHHRDKHPTCQNITSLLLCEVSYCPSGRTTKIRGWKDVMFIVLPKSCLIKYWLTAASSAHTVRFWGFVQQLCWRDGLVRMFKSLQRRSVGFLAGALKDIQRSIPEPLLHCQGSSTPKSTAWRHGQL